MQTHSQDILIRRARREDVREIVRMLADDHLGSQRESYQDPLPPAYYVAFEEIDRDEHNELLVAELDNQIVGTFQLTILPGLSFRGSKRAQIESVRVDERYRNKGIGQKMMAWAIARAREQGCYQLQLSTHKSRTNAHRFYERLGFVASHEGMKLSLVSKENK